MDDFNEVKLLSNSILLREQSNLESIVSKATLKNIKFYFNNYLFALLKVMEDQYICTQYLLGESNFKYFAKKYIYQNPSTTQNINIYAKNFGSFLSGLQEIEHLFFIEHICLLDRAYYLKDEFKETKVELYKGCFMLWTLIKQAISNGDEITHFSIDQICQDQVDVIDLNKLEHLN